MWTMVGWVLVFAVPAPRPRLGQTNALVGSHLGRGMPQLLRRDPGCCPDRSLSASP